MMIYLKLLFTFFKIGLFSFGGGYAMIPLIQNEIEMNGWTKASDFINIIAVGPVAICSATFVGTRIAGLFGGVIATIGVAIPSVIIIFIISSFFFRIQKNPINIMVFYGIRPVVTGLIAAAAVIVAGTAIVKKDLSMEVFNHVLNNPSSFFDFRGIVILVASLVALVKFKVHPILMIAGAGVAGVIIYS
jgi:chromate transporter